MARNFVTFYDIQRMYLEIRTNELKFLDYEFPYYSIENDVVIKKSVHIKDIVVTNGFITTKNSVHTTNNLIEFLSSLSHYLVLQDDFEFYFFYFFRKDLEDFLCCIFYNTELRKLNVEECKGDIFELRKLDEHYADILGSKVVRIYQNLKLLYPNLKELITVRNEMLSKIPFSEREFSVNGHNNIILRD